MNNNNEQSHHIIDSVAGTVAASEQPVQTNTSSSKSIQTRGRDYQVTLRHIVSTVPEASPGRNTFPAYLMRFDEYSIRGMVVEMSEDDVLGTDPINVAIIFSTPEICEFYGVQELSQLYQIQSDFKIRFIPSFTAAAPGNIVKTFSLHRISTIDEQCCRLDFELQESRYFLTQNNKRNVLDKSAFSIPKEQWRELIRLDAQIDTQLNTTECKTILFTGASDSSGVSTLAWWFSAGISRLLSRRVLYVVQSEVIQKDLQGIGQREIYRDNHDLMIVNYAKLLQLIEERSVVQAFEVLQDMAKDSFTHIVFDAPPVRNSPITTALADKVMGTFLVTRQGNTGRRQLANSVEILQNRDSEFLGTLLNQG